MEVTHPRAGDAPLPSVVTGPDGTGYRIKDGVVDAPKSVAESIADAWGRRYDADPDSLLNATCDAVKTDGEVCGRDLPCPYHTESEK